MQKAFAFDFDGVVLDSLTALQETYFEFLVLHGKNGSIEEFNALNGPSLSEIVSNLKESHNLEGSHQVLFDKYISLLDKGYVNAPLIDGILECLLFLKRMNFPIALVTSSVQHVVKDVLHKNNILSIFDYIVTGEEVKKSKPEPDIYLKLIEEYPHYSWFAIEDSDNGIKAAHTAGLKTIFFDPKEIGTAQKVFCRVSSMNRLLKRLEELQFDCCVVDSFNELCVELSDASHLQLSEETTLEIDRIWQNAQRQKPLNDDIVLYYLSHQTFGDECLISAFWGPYRYFYAKLSDPTLSIPIFPLAVSGICLNDVGQVLIGKRNGVSEYQDCYEFVPSGGLNNKYSTANSLNYKQQLIGEFKEETKLDQIIFSINTLGLVFDLVHEVYDICCSIFLAGSPRLPSNTSEYKGLEWAALNDTKIEMVIPTSRALLSLFNGSH